MNTSSLFSSWQSVKRRNSYLNYGQPLITKNARGCIIECENGNSYIDFLMGWGCVLFGYSDEKITQSIQDSPHLFANFNNHSELEFRLAEEVSKWYDVPMVTGYFLNGSDATTVAVRSARAVTNRSGIVSCGYHGWHSWAQPTSCGVLFEERSHSSNYRYSEVSAVLEKVKQKGRDLAAVVIETPVPKAAVAEIQNVCRLVKHAGGLLIFDEVKSSVRRGFCIGFDTLNIMPDFAIYGKAVGGGLPLSLLAMKTDVDEQVPSGLKASATYWGHPLSLMVALSVIDRANETSEISNLSMRASAFQTNFNALFRSEGLSIESFGDPMMPSIHVPHEYEQTFYSSAFNHGLYIRPNHCLFLSTTHDDKVLFEALERLRLVAKDVISSTK